MPTTRWQFSYAGIELPPPDGGGLSYALQPIDNAERNANGDMVLQRVAMKRTLSGTWSRLSGGQAKLILSTLEANRLGKLVFYNIVKDDMDELEVYYGAGVKLDYLRYDDRLNGQLYSSLSVSFIEI